MSLDQQTAALVINYLSTVDGYLSLFPLYSLCTLSKGRNSCAEPLLHPLVSAFNDYCTCSHADHRLQVKWNLSTNVQNKIIQVLQFSPGEYDSSPPPPPLERQCPLLHTWQVWGCKSHSAMISKFCKFVTQGCGPQVTNYMQTICI